MSGIVERLTGLVSRSKNLIGLDIGYDSVKGVELYRDERGYQLAPYGIVPISAGTDPAERRGATLAALKTLMREHKFSTRRVATAVSGENVIVRILRLPIFDASEESLEFAVRGEARDFIPFDMEDVVFDFQKLGELEHENSRVAEVLIVAVRKDVIEERLSLLRDAGLEPVVIDVASFALCNALSECGAIKAGEAVALVDIGGQTTSVAILRDGVTRFTRDLSIGGRNILDAITGELEVDRREAEGLTHKYGILLSAQTGESRGPGAQAPSHDDYLLSGGHVLHEEKEKPGGSLYDESEADFKSLYETPEPEPEIKLSQPAPRDILSDISRTIDQLTPEVDATALEYGPEGQRVAEICEHFIGEIIGEVKRSFLYYENQLGGEVISRIILSGGLSKMRNIEKYFEHVLDVKCHRLEPLTRIRSEMSRQEAEELYPLLGVGIGLSLRSFFHKS